jgi:hypothetical protein
MVERKHHSVTEIDSECDEVIDKGGRETVVRLSLYAVLMFLVLIFATVMGFFYNNLNANELADRIVREKVIILEGKFDTINIGISELKSSMKDVTTALKEHEQKGKR